MAYMRRLGKRRGRRIGSSAARRKYYRNQHWSRYTARSRRR